MTNYKSENQRDLYQDFQIVSEGDVVATPSLFGGGSVSSPAFVSNPSFTFIGTNQRFDYTYSAEGFPIQFLTSENRTAIKIVKKSAMLSIDCDLTDSSYNGKLQWLLGLNNTNFNSYAGFFSRKPAATTYYIKNFGIIPQSTTLTLPADNKPVHIRTELLVCNPVTEDTNGPTIGSGSYASTSTAAVLPTDGGVDSFTYNSVVYKTRGISVTVRPTYAIMDADDALVIQHAVPVRRDISGTVSVFKKQGADAILSDISTGTLRPMSRILKPSTGTSIDFTDVLMSDKYRVDNSAVKSDSTIQDFDFTAGGLTLTLIP